jgi:hypothetical protein
MPGMKRSPLVCIALLLVFTTSCSKKMATVADSGCIARVVPTTEQTPLRTTQVDSIRTLFAQNNLQPGQLQFIEFIPDVYSDSTITPQAQVWANLFLNGLPVFQYNEVFVFNGGIFDTAYLYTGTPANNDTTGHRTLSSLRSSFMQHVAEAITYWPLNIKPTIPSAKTYTDSCLVAKLGYLDVTYIPGNTAQAGTLIKVWQVTPLSTIFPCVYVRDDNGMAWGEVVFIP